jgi:hypothetical protein
MQEFYVNRASMIVSSRICIAGNDHGLLLCRHLKNGQPEAEDDR